MSTTTGAAAADRASTGAVVGDRVLKWIERAAAVTIVLLLVGLHLIFLRSAGGLWRDEINSVNLVSLPSVADVYDKLQYDSFPMLWFVVLRTWTHVGLGQSDLVLHSLGLATGLGLLGALWYAARALGSRAPLLSLAVFALCPTALVYGDWLRAFGLGTLLIVLMLGATWRLVNKPTTGRILAAGMITLLSAQCLYHNCVLIFAICLGATATALRRRAWKVAILPLAVGAVAAASLTPYLGTMSRMAKWTMMVKIPVDFPWLFSKVAQALAPSGMFPLWVWLACAALAVVACIWRMISPAPECAAEQRDLATFLLVTMVVSGVGYLVFLKVLSYPTQGWYYLPAMAVLIVSMEAAINLLAEATRSGRVVRLACASLIVAASLSTAWSWAHLRTTNIDLVAGKLQSLADKDDLILLNPFYFGITFARYYHGPTPWMMLPNMDDHFLHRYDLLKAKTAEVEPITPLLSQMANTLKHGHRVWLVGYLDFLREGETPGSLPPAPNSPYGWSQAAYTTVWSRQAAFILQSHAQTVRQVPVPVNTPLNPFETAFLVETEGWRP